MIFNMVGGGGGSSTKSTIIVSIDTGSTVAAYSDSSYQTLVKTASEKSTGEYWLTGLDNGTYYLKATKGSDVSTMPYTISEYGVYRISMAYRTIPDFSYSGTYEVVEDDDTPIADVAHYNDANWKIRFLTSGTLNFTNLYGARNGIDVFLVGAGGSKPQGGDYKGGAGGGYTLTHTAVTVAAGENYAVTIGEPTATNGGSSQFGNLTAASGGHAPSNTTGGAGGSGGGGGRSANGTAGAGGSDGSNGTSAAGAGGAGQGTTTREFGEVGETLYGGGGGGKSDNASGANGWTGSATNFGHGAHGNGYNTAYEAGGSGIVIIRNARS